jgi:hypothetical protein
MVGVITGRDILSHPVTTIRCFGWRVFLRAIAPGQSKPLLRLLQENGSWDSACSDGAATIKQCVGLELRAKRIYAALAETFRSDKSTTAFFAGLADQEQRHADLLQICSAAAARGHGMADVFGPWQDCITRLERQMDAFAASVPEVRTIDAAFQLVLRIESSEINDIFRTAVAAMPADSVKKLKPFRNATEDHLTYIWNGLTDRSRSSGRRQQKRGESFHRYGVNGSH